MTTLRGILNNGNPNSTDSAIQAVQLGEALALLPRTIRGAVTSNKLVLPEYAKAASLLSVYGIGTANGYLTPLAPGSAATPTAGQVSIDAQGNIITASADGITALVATYLAVEGQVYQEQIAVASNAGSLLGSRRAALILSATVDAGTTLGAKTPVKRPATPSTTQVAIGAGDDTTIAFASADAVSLATVRYIAVPGSGTAPIGVGVGLDTITLGAV